MTKTILTSNIKYDQKHISKKKKKTLFVAMLRPRMIEEKMLSLLRQGKISKWFSGIGQEAIAVGCTMAMNKEEWIFPMHRNLGVFTTRGIPLNRLFSQWQGKVAGFTSGRDRSFHFGTKEYKIWGMISHLGPQLSIADGIALGHLLSGEKNVSLAFTGEGGTSEGEFHEALNVAAVWNLPVIFAVENNGYGLSTPSSEQFKCDSIADKGPGYGIESYSIDGNNVLEVFSKVSKLAKDIRKKPRPVLLEFRTFRMRGHEEASGTNYVPDELMAYWSTRDPINNFELHLLEENILTEQEIKELRATIKAEINNELKISNAAAPVKANEENELDHVYADHRHEAIPPGPVTQELRFIDAISDGLNEVLNKWEHSILMGQDIAEYGGVFKITEGMLDRFGKDRIRNTPLCESAILGIALGLSMKGYRSMVEMQFADFVSCGFNQIINNIAKIHYRWGHAANIVIRMPCGGGVGAGPFHSQSNEAWFTHTPGLKILYPSSPNDAKGLLISAFEDPNPVLFFEHKLLYRTVSEQVSKGYYNIEIGKGILITEGSDLSIITYGMGVHWAINKIEKLDLSADIIDLRSLIPIDYEMITETVKKTNKVLILHEDTLFGGIGGEISAYISEHLFEYLDAPIIRVGSLDTPVPFDTELEKQFMANSRLEEAIHKLLKY